MTAHSIVSFLGLTLLFLSWGVSLLSKKPYKNIIGIVLCAISLGLFTANLIYTFVK